MSAKASSERLVRVLPVETDREHREASGEKRPMQRHWHPDKFGRFFPNTLTVEQIRPVLVAARVKMEKLTLQREGDLIIYHYKDRPLLKLHLKDGQFYAPNTEIAQHGEEAVQHQAHIVLDNLKKAGITGAVIGKPVYPASARHVLGQLKTYK